VLETKRPKLKMLSKDFVQQIIDEAFDVLKKTGVLVENQDALKLLKEAGCDIKDQTVYFKKKIVEKALETTPAAIHVYDRDGEPAMKLEGDQIHFDPG